VRKDKVSWDVELRYSDAGMAKVMRALVECRGHFTDSHAMKYDGSPRHTWPLALRIFLPEGAEGKFQELSGIKPEEPPRISGL
jgi:hypothetical protein